MKVDSQAAAVMKHLKRRPITQAQAAELYGIWRLADVIYKLRNRGERINTETVESRNRYGHTVSYARYRRMPEIGAWAA